METTGERDQQEKRIGPTVSKDKWVNHAKTKMSRGYKLIVGVERKTANFHSAEKGYEACSYQVARQLIKDGVVHKVREHHLGDVYELIEMPAPRPQVRSSAPFDNDLDALLERLDDEPAGEAEVEPAE